MTTTGTSIKIADNKAKPPDAFGWVSLSWFAIGLSYYFVFLLIGGALRESKASRRCGRQEILEKIKNVKNLKKSFHIHAAKLLS